MREAPSPDCLDACIGMYKAGRPYDVSVELQAEPSTMDSGRSRVYLVVKSLALPSIDEAWILSGLLASLRQRHTVRILEYEPHRAGKGGIRNREFVRGLKRAVSEGAGIVALVPHLFTLDLMDLLDERLRSMLEDNYIISVSTAFRNILYLPDPSSSPSDIEIVGKRNSSASYERVKWLSLQARGLGFDVREVFLSDNSEIYKYVMNGVPLSFYTRIPATKISLIGAALAKCGVLDGLRVLERMERSEHTLYAIRVPPETVESIMDGLERLSRSSELDSDVLHWIGEGCRMELEHLGVVL